MSRLDVAQVLEGLTPSGHPTHVVSDGRSDRCKRSASGTVVRFHLHARKGSVGSWCCCVVATHVRLAIPVRFRSIPLA
jgi:hypothetical protein